MQPFSPTMQTFGDNGPEELGGLRQDVKKFPRPPRVRNYTRPTLEIALLADGVETGGTSITRRPSFVSHKQAGSNRTSRCKVDLWAERRPVRADGHCAASPGLTAAPRRSDDQRTQRRVEVHFPQSKGDHGNIPARSIAEGRPQRTFAMIELINETARSERSRAAWSDQLLRHRTAPAPSSRTTLEASGAAERP